MWYLSFFDLLHFNMIISRSINVAAIGIISLFSGLSNIPLHIFVIHLYQFSSVAQSCLTLWDPMACTTPDFPVHHQLLESVQTQVHRVGDAMQPCHPLLSPSPFAFNLSQHQGLFQWVSSSHQVAKVLELLLQNQSFQWTFRTISFRMDWFDLPAVQGTLQESSPTPQFKSIHSSTLNLLYGSTIQPCMSSGKTIALTR